MLRKLPNKQVQVGVPGVTCGDSLIVLSSTTFAAKL